MWTTLAVTLFVVALHTPISVNHITLALAYTGCCAVFPPDLSDWFLV